MFRPAIFLSLSIQDLSTYDMRCPRAKVGCLPSRSREKVSAKISVHCPSANRTYKLDRNLAERKVRRGGFRWCDNFSIVEIELDLTPSARRALYDGPLGTGNALPFTRICKKLLKPEPLHYPIPACGARTRFQNVSIINTELLAVTSLTSL